MEAVADYTSIIIEPAKGETEMQNDEFVARLKQFLVGEFNLPFEEACAMGPEEIEALLEKCEDIELEEASKSDPISERGKLAAAWVNIIQFDE